VQYVWWVDISISATLYLIMRDSIDSEIHYVRKLAGGELGLGIDETNRELDLLLTDMLETGTFCLTLPFHERWKVASPVQEPVEHETFLRAGLNPLRHSDLALRVLSPFTQSHQKHAFSSLSVEAGEGEPNVVFHVTPEDVDVVYSVEIPQEKVRKASLVVIDFALRK
jgi:hypothetical protein